MLGRFKPSTNAVFVWKHPKSFNLHFLHAESCYETRRNFSRGHRAYSNLDAEAIRHVITGKRVTAVENPGIRLESRFITESTATELVKELRTMDQEFGFTTEGHGLHVEARDAPRTVRCAHDRESYLAEQQK